MRFLDALVWAKVGNKIRREEDKEIYYYYIPKEVFITDDDGEKHIPHDGCLCYDDAVGFPKLSGLSTEDILADDWVVGE